MTNVLLQQLNEDLSAVVTQVRRSLVKISQDGGGIGSGTVWHPDGLIVTNAHVAQRRPGRLEVTLADGRTLPARLLAVDEKHDLAALSVRRPGCRRLSWGTRRRSGQGNGCWG